MARPLQRRKNRSSRPKIRQKSKSKRINIKSNSIIAAHWDKNLTLSQNYRRLGLTSKLNRPAGGVEPTTKSTEPNEANSNHGEMRDLTIKSDHNSQRAIGSVKVIRDAEGKIISVVRDGEKQKRGNPLNDPLNELSEDEMNIANPGVSRGIVPELEEASKMIQKKPPRKQSKREQEWIGRLIDTWNDDLAGMSRDRNLNPMQHSPGDLRKRIKLFQQNKINASNDVDDE